MDEKQPSEPTGAGATATEAAAGLAEIQRRQEHVVMAVLVPGWYWWAVAAGMVAIGAARDTGDPVVQAVAIPLAAVIMAVLTCAMIPAIRRRVQVHSATQPGARGAAAILGLILLIDGTTVGTAASLHAARVAYPGTIGTAAGAAVIVIAGPLVNRYLSKLMFRQARLQMSGAPEAGGRTS